MPQISQSSNHPFHRLIRSLSTTRFFSWILSPTLRYLDTAVLKISGGRSSATGTLAGLPVVVLTTRGRVTGKLRSTPLVGIADGDRVVLIASKFGSPHHPGWYHNICANPEVTLTTANHSHAYIAREALGEEWNAYWAIATDMLPGYRGYRERAGERRIPILVLEPARS